MLHTDIKYLLYPTKKVHQLPITSFGKDPKARDECQDHESVINYDLSPVALLLKFIVNLYDPKKEPNEVIVEAWNHFT